jgi:hypothetical protein
VQGAVGLLLLLLQVCGVEGLPNGLRWPHAARQLLLLLLLLALVQLLLHVRLLLHLSRLLLQLLLHVSLLLLLLLQRCKGRHEQL